MTDPVLVSLFGKYLDGTISMDEVRQLQFLVESEDDLADLNGLLEAAFANKKLAITGDYEVEEMYREFRKRIVAEGREEVIAGRSFAEGGEVGSAGDGAVEEGQIADIRPVRWWRKIAAAAVIVLMLGGGGYFWWHRAPDGAGSAGGAVQMAADVAPGGNKAILTLAGGQRIVLDNAAKGKLMMQGNADVMKTDSGKLAYTSMEHKSGLTGENQRGGTMVYNTLSTPRGGQYQLTLSDGTRVWLNAASSITYPTVFMGKGREVTITGEAYFEVAKNTQQPFTVRAGDMMINVLGTSFNVNAYSDDPVIRTTLVEGAVKVSRGQSATLLKPGEQAEVTDGVKVVSDADVETVLAWKNGLFQFNRTDMESIMRQVSRWYDVEVSYPGGPVHRRFSGVVSRSSNLSQVLKIMEQANIRCTIEGRKIMIMQ